MSGRTNEGAPRVISQCCSIIRACCWWEYEGRKFAGSVIAIAAIPKPLLRARPPAREKATRWSVECLDVRIYAGSQTRERTRAVRANSKRRAERGVRIWTCAPSSSIQACLGVPSVYAVPTQIGGKKLKGSHGTTLHRASRTVCLRLPQQH